MSLSNHAHAISATDVIVFNARQSGILGAEKQYVFVHTCTIQVTETYQILQQTVQNLIRLLLRNSLIRVGTVGNSRSKEFDTFLNIESHWKL